MWDVFLWARAIVMYFFFPGGVQLLERVDREKTSGSRRTHENATATCILRVSASDYERGDIMILDPRRRMAASQSSSLISIQASYWVVLCHRETTPSPPFPPPSRHSALSLSSCTSHNHPSKIIVPVWPSDHLLWLSSLLILCQARP